MKRKKFKSTFKPNTDDNEGTVQVCVILKNKKGHVKGNITKYLSLQATKVSEVFNAIEKALIG